MVKRREQFMGAALSGMGLVLGAFLLLLPLEASAAPPSRMKICGDEWSAAKVAGKVPAGQTWQDFYKNCSARLKANDSTGAQRGAGSPPRDSSAVTRPAAAPVQSAKPSAASSDKAKNAAQSRQKQCGPEWRKLKAAGQIPAGQKWPQFWSACNARLKKAG